jgi:hypothetical protein
VIGSGRGIETPPLGYVVSMSSDPHHLLRIYVRDHHAASVAGLSLAQRCAHNNAGTEFEDALVELADRIADDQHSLEEVMDGWLTVSPSPVRVAVARAGELVGRVKSNGRVATYSPSSRVVELEGLVAGVSAKRQLWRCLAAVADADATFADPVAAARLDTLEAGAADQLDRLLALHRRAVDLAFVDRRRASV